ncbi:MAG: phage tail assembly chaperone [Hyphomicrobiaceae bacterium]|nr:phage tail assembly chaperone [Hyphomicrobiaceae bacterium]
MAVALGLLRLPPATFWAMTPKELAAALAAIIGPAAPGPPSRSELARLMQSFPDRQPVR